MNDYLATIIVGICTGFGSAVGNYFALKYAIDHMDKIPTVKEKIKESVNKLRWNKT